MDTDDKPFQCPKCDLCFANSDRLAVHQLMHLKQPSRLQVKIPVSGNDISVTDQTPTPSSFLKTADVEGSPLFHDLNPFDRDFKFASSQPSSTDQIQVVTTASCNEGLKTPEILNITKITQEIVQDSEKHNELSEEEILSRVKQESFQVMSQSQKPEPGIEVDSSVSSTTPATASGINTDSQDQSSTELLQSVLSQIKAQQTEELLQKETVEQQKQAVNANQDLLREQLKTLINSGLIKIQITPYPASTKVQATIVGNVATTKTVATGHIDPSTVTPAVISASKIVPKGFPIVASSLTSTGTETKTVNASSLPAQTSIALPAILPGTNSQIAKQKLKQCLQTDQVSRATMANPGSSQGKYKDIILDDEMLDSELGKRRGRAPVDESSPEEKRRKFLERNRAAASRCRQKRKIWVNQLEKKSDDLVATNNHLMTEIVALRNEVAQLKALLLAHKDCPVTQQQKTLVNQIASGIGTFVSVPDGQLITIQQLTGTGIREASDEEVASSALTDMAARATIELSKKTPSGVVTVQASDGSLTNISSKLLPR